MTSVYKRGGRANRNGSYYVAYTDENGRRRTVRGCADRQATEAMARGLEAEVMLRKRGIIDTKSDRYAQAEQKPLDEHLGDYVAVLTARERSQVHLDKTKQRVHKVLALCKAERISDLSPSGVQRAIGELRQEGLGLGTCNHYLTAIKGYVRWLWRDGRVQDDCLASLSKFDAKLDKRHERRALEPDDLRRLLEATREGPTRFGMTGPERAMLYRVAVETGLRASELRSLKVSSFDLDACTVTVQAAYSKRRRQDVLPLRPDTAEALRNALGGKTAQAAAFRIPTSYRTSRMIQADLADAGIEYQDDSGRYADFHALRHSTGSMLAAAGVNPKTAQDIMRHSDINLTMSRYSHIYRGAAAEAVTKLPNLSTPPATETRRATGTYDLTSSEAAAHLQRAGTPKEQKVSSPDIGTVGKTEPSRGKPEQHKLLKTQSVSTNRQSIATHAKRGKTSGPGRIRTYDQGIMSPLLYR